MSQDPSPFDPQNEDHSGQFKRVAIWILKAIAIGIGVLGALIVLGLLLLFGTCALSGR
ncbi:hypothetical protein [Ahniella affigens]|uniref:hypothetical protein n=1 Tax=Ahniella affigens TaxID=2021234 RepID=UPI001472FC13|nr:hypothetical protein [Ahniella affigens]